MSAVDRSARDSRSRRSIAGGTTLGSVWPVFIGGAMTVTGYMVAVSTIDVPAKAIAGASFCCLLGLFAVHLIAARWLAPALERWRLTHLPFPFSYRSYAKALGYRREQTRIRLRVSFQQPLREDERTQLRDIGDALRADAELDGDDLIITRAMATLRTRASGEVGDDSANHRVHRFVRRVLYGPLVDLHRAHPIRRVAVRLAEAKR